VNIEKNNKGNEILSNAKCRMSRCRGLLEEVFQEGKGLLREDVSGNWGGGFLSASESGNVARINFVGRQGDVGGRDHVFAQSGRAASESGVYHCLEQKLRNQAGGEERLFRRTENVSSQGEFLEKNYPRHVRGVRNCGSNSNRRHPRQGREKGDRGFVCVRT